MVSSAPAGDSAAMTLNPTSSPPAMLHPGADHGAPIDRANAAPHTAAGSSGPAAMTLVGGNGEPSRPASERQATPAQVLIGHGQRLARAGLRALIDGDEGLAVAGEAETGEYALELARRRLPDLVVLDLDLPGRDTLETTREIVGDPTLANIRVLILTSADDDEAILGPLRAGAAGVLLSDSEPADLLRGLRLLAAGETPISPSLMRAVIADVAARLAPPRSNATALEELTAREREVVALAALGLNNHEIAQHLVISPATSRTHVSRAMRKLDARDRAQLVAFAYQTGLAEPGAIPLPSPVATPASEHVVALHARRERPGGRLGTVVGATRSREVMARPERSAALMPLGA
jgi:DNA-binding NarL/FixJ family response regulator